MIAESCKTKICQHVENSTISVMSQWGGGHQLLQDLRGGTI